jgi:membrane protease YdiL (CAAX protease family)
MAALRTDRRDTIRHLSALGRVLLFWLATMAILAATAPAATHFGDGSVLSIGAIASLLTLGLTLLFVRWERKSLRDFGIHVTRRTPYLFSLGLLAGFALVAVHTAVTALFAPVHWAAAGHANPSQLVLASAGFLLLAMREELAFRGYPLRKLAADLGPWTAQLIIAALFAIEHWIGGASWTNALFGAGMGSLVFGTAALVTRGLAMPIGLHAAYNIADWARGGKGGDGLWRLAVAPGSEQTAQLISMTCYVAVTGIAMVALCVWGRQLNRTEVQCPLSTHCGH